MDCCFFLSLFFLRFKLFRNFFFRGSLSGAIYEQRKERQCPSETPLKSKNVYIDITCRGISEARRASWSVELRARILCTISSGI